MGYRILTRSILPLALLLASASLARAVGFSAQEAASKAPASREVKLLRGVVKTTRGSRDESHRKLLPAQSRYDTYLVGVSSGEGDVLREMVNGFKGSAQVYTYVPADHFIVFATLDQIMELQDKLAATWALLEGSYKLALEVDTTVAAASKLVSALSERDNSNSGGLQTLSTVAKASSAFTFETEDAESSQAGSGTVSSTRRLLSSSSGGHASYTTGGKWDAVASPVQERTGEGGYASTASVDSALAELAKMVRIDGSLDDGSLSARLMVLLVTTDGVDSNASKDLVKEWKKGLRKLLDIQPGSASASVLSVEVTAPGIAIVNACPEHLEAVSKWVSEQPAVVWVQPQQVAKETNMYAAQIIQTGFNPKVSEAGQLPDVRKMEKPYWAVGLDGSGEVVGVVDSGSALGSCYLNDPDVDIAANTKANSEGVSVFSSDVHRKVKLYYGWMGMQDETGHGTHTSGTVAGSPLIPGVTDMMPYMNATGMAPGAKLAIFDAFSWDQPDELVIPMERGDFLYELQQEAGARISSNSWGESMVTYHSTSMLLDKYLWHHPEFLNVQAAGNDGDIKEGKVGTISSPGNAKNALTVGAVEGMANKELPSTIVKVSIEIFDEPLDKSQPRPEPVGSIHGLPATQWHIQGTVKDLVNREFLMKQSDPPYACSSLNNGPMDAENDAVFFIRGSCTFSMKADAITASGAPLGIMSDTRQGTLVPAQMTIEEPDSKTVPILTISREVGEKLQLYFFSGFSLYINITTYSDLKDVCAGDLVAKFSSYGPTLDGRIKPDIVATGSILSSFVDHYASGDDPIINDQCANLAFLQGTSMAAPVVSGAAAITRQYLREGFLEAGARDLSRTIDPSGILTRAILISGAVDLKNGYSIAASERLDPAPSMFQGFGQLSLRRSLPLAQDQLGWKLQVKDMVAIPSLSTEKYTVIATGWGPLIVTLSWYDYFSYPGARIGSLINNLDLTVRGLGEDGQEYIWAGNMRQPVLAAEESQLERDTKNTLERVVIENPPSGVFTITVTSGPINGWSEEQPHQYFALAALGGLLESGELLRVEKQPLANGDEPAQQQPSSQEEPQSPAYDIPPLYYQEAEAPAYDIPPPYYEEPAQGRRGKRKNAAPPKKAKVGKKPN